MSKVLSQEEIKHRLIRLRNVERLYQEQKIQLQLVREENKVLKLEVATLRAENTELKRTVQDMSLRIEELASIVFGKKKKKRDDTDPPMSTHTSVPRTKASYHHPSPTESEVTETVVHPIDLCTTCSVPLTKKSIHTHYIIDLPKIAPLSVVKHLTERGYCARCHTWQCGAPLPPAKVLFGNRVQVYITYLSVVARLSITQIQYLLWDTDQCSVSEGEIVKILNRQAIKYRPEYEQLKEEIRGSPIVHLDETGWKLFLEKLRSFAWSMSTPQGKAVFLVGESRGGGNVEKLLGPDYEGVVVTDDFGAYKKLLRHQLCWAHIVRKFRDLAQSEGMDAPTKQHHRQAYETLCGIYAEIRGNRLPSLYAKYAVQLTALAQTAALDCKKLRTYKATLLTNIPKYLTCLSDSAIPLTNNQAERSLRHLVLKRKISFGSHSKQTAENLAVLLSVFMSKRSENLRGWFQEMLGV